ncbi:MAG: chemotaxis protein CheD [Oscillospiraceae bacterium]|nr:chemotaxis protein CheD [Oscillospiraceae bacterium]
MGQLVIGISDLKVARPPDTLITYALGSCVGICLLDAAAHVAGLSHIMLPDSKLSPNDKNIAKFADSAIPELVRQMEKLGANRARMKAKIAGGAQMFEVKGATTANAAWQVGQRNVASVKTALQVLHIPIIAQDILENYGRTVTFEPATGVMGVKALNRPVKNL